MGFSCAASSLLLPILLAIFFISSANGEVDPNDGKIMRQLAQSLTNSKEKLGWDVTTDPCKWKGVACGIGNRVMGIDFQNKNVQGKIPPGFSQLSALASVSIQRNMLSGPLPSFEGMANLQSVFVNGNQFSSVTAGTFKGLSSLQVLAMDDNPFSPWSVPQDIQEASGLVNFSASNAGLVGSVPAFFGQMANLQSLSLSNNNLSGPIPDSFSGSNIVVLSLCSQRGEMLSGGIHVLRNMTMLVQVFLFSNAFSGPIPDLSPLASLQEIIISFNRFTGLVPQSLVSLPSLKSISLASNFLQGSFPSFPRSVDVKDGSNTYNSFCLTTPGPCDHRVQNLLSVAGGFGYPYVLASNWKGNDPCSGWRYVSCDANGEVTVLNMANLNLTGTLSPALANLTALTQLILDNSNVSGTIPSELTGLSNLRKLDLRNNNIEGPLPTFKPTVTLLLDGNPQLANGAHPKPHQPPSANYTPIDAPSPIPSPSAPSTSTSPSAPSTSTAVGADPKESISATHERSRGHGAASHGPFSSPKSPGVIAVSAVGGAFGFGLLALASFAFVHRKRLKSKSKSGSVRECQIQSQGSQSPDVGLFKMKRRDPAENIRRYSTSVSSRPSAEEVYEDEEKIPFTVQILRRSTEDFGKQNILGRGGFGVVYKGKLPNERVIAVKRMEAGIISEKGLKEFKAEISVLTKVRHRHLVSLLGHCMEGKERLLVYEYVPQGPLSHHLFEWEKRNLRPLDWMSRLVILLDVARGVEYLHSLAHKSFIHRDLKPSNILLSDEMRAKVSDFGLVRLAADDKCSVSTKVAGTFGYLAPEYAATGRVTTKADVFSYGVVLMEMITGRKALDESQPEDTMHLVSQFRRLHGNKENLRPFVDPALERTEETFQSICTVAELAGHCTAREPYQRPDMSHAVNVLSTLVEIWKPCDSEDEDVCGISMSIPLPEALRRWQSTESSFLSQSSARSLDTTVSVPSKPLGFAESFQSSDGR